MSPAQKPAPSATQAEELLAALEGVVSAHVVAEQGGRIVEIHILAAPDLHPKQVVRNVESALYAGLGIPVDRRVVSVAQIRSGQFQRSDDSDDDDTDAPHASASTAEPPGNGQIVILERLAGGGRQPREPKDSAPAPTQGRLEYVRYEARRDGGGCVCEVVLRDQETEFTGTGEAPPTAVGRAEAAARAVVDAVEQARPDTRLAIEGAIISSSRGRNFVLVSARAIQDRITVSLSGAAAVQRSPEEAAILAALQATNRWSA